MKIKIYEIISSDNTNHLNGQIIICDRGKELQSFAILMVNQGDKENKKDTFHITSEEISLDALNGTLKTWKGFHKKLDAKNETRTQSWLFKELPGDDSKTKYPDYLHYELVTVDCDNPDICATQGDGTGTGGNTGGN